MSMPLLLDTNRPIPMELVNARSAYEGDPSASTAYDLVRVAGFILDKEHYRLLDHEVKSFAGRTGLKVRSSNYTKPSPKMSFGIAEFRFSIPGFTKDDVEPNPKRLGPTWFLTPSSRIAWKVLIPTTDAFLRGYENPIVKREYSGGAYGVTGSMRLESLRRRVFRYFDRANNKRAWMKLLFDKRDNPSYIGAVETKMAREN